MVSDNQNQDEKTTIKIDLDQEEGNDVFAALYSMGLISKKMLDKLKNNKDISVSVEQEIPPNTFKKASQDN